MSPPSGSRQLSGIRSGDAIAGVTRLCKRDLDGQMIFQQTNLAMGAAKINPPIVGAVTRNALPRADLARQLPGDSMLLFFPDQASAARPLGEGRSCLATPPIRAWRAGWARRCPRRDSNPYSAAFKAGASAVWTTRASECCGYPPA